MSESVVPAALPRSLFQRYSSRADLRSQHPLAPGSKTIRPSFSRKLRLHSAPTFRCYVRQRTEMPLRCAQTKWLARGGNQSALYVRPNAPLVTGGCYRMLAEVRTVTMTRTNHESNVGSRPPADRPCRGSQQPTLRTNAGTALCKGSTFSRLVDSRGAPCQWARYPVGSQGDPATSLPLR